MKKSIWILICVSLMVSATGLAEVVVTEANNGNLVMEDVPAIPESIVDGLNRYQNVRSAGFRSWDQDGDRIFVSTRFADVSQIHRVDHPGGARRQITFFKEPVGGLDRQPGGKHLAFTMDAGGSEFSQIFLLDPAGTAEAVMLTDGESRNTSVVWDQDGRRIAFQSTRRNGASNDVWLMDAADPQAAKMVWESPDGTYWAPADFSPDGRQLLVINYVGNADSRLHLLDVASGKTRMLAGDPADPSSNFPVAFDREGRGIYFLTDVQGEFQQLAWRSLDEGAEPVILTGDIPWNVEGGSVSEDRTRGAFTVNEDGLTRLYLLDMVGREYVPVEGIPTGLIGGMGFSPDGLRLAMTINTPKTPSDSFVLELGEKAMGCPVEIEFAGNFSDNPGEKPTFRLLQLRPFLEHEETLMIDDLDVTDKDLFVSSSVVSGNRVISDIQDIIYVNPEVFDLTQTVEMVPEIMDLNRTLVDDDLPYILIGPGRWGTCERHLGIPVDWSDINGARVIMEVDLADFQVDHSQGSHFFHNISSAGIPYFYIKYNSETDFLDWKWMNSVSLVQETKYFRHVRTKEPLLVIANGKKRSGKIIKPEPARPFKV